MTTPHRKCPAYGKTCNHFFNVRKASSTSLVRQNPFLLRKNTRKNASNATRITATLQIADLYLKWQRMIDRNFLTTPRTNLLTVKPSVDSRQHAESTIMQLLQQHHFYEEMAQLQIGSTIDKKSSLYTLIYRHSRCTTSWEADSTAAYTSNLMKKALWFFLKPISTTDWYINNTDWPDIKKKYWHWTSYVSKATGLFDATPLYHPWSANARFASSCLQKPLDNKCPGSPRREDTTFTTIHILGMWHLWTIYGSRSKHRRKALRSLDFHFLLYIHVQVTHLPHPFSLTISISLFCRYLLPQKRL